MRVKDLQYDELDAEQKAIYDEIVAGPRGKVHGPFKVWLHRAKLLDRGQALGLYCRYNSGLDRRLSELAILVISAFWKVGNEWTDHYQNAVDEGVDPDALEALRTGGTPAFTRPDEQILYDFAAELHRDNEVSDTTYARAEEVLGKDLIIDMIAVFGYYVLIGMTIKTFRVPNVPGASDPFADV
mgnify:CR=1 FL=1